MTRKKVSLLLIIFTIALPAFSIGFGFHAFEIRTNPEFSRGIFPTSLLYQFDFPVPDFIPGNTTEVDFRIDNGIDFRTLRQHPETGIPFATDPTNADWQFPHDYITIYDEMNLIFAQGFFKTPMSNKDLLKLWTTFDIRFENSYERFSYLLNPEEMEGLFLLSPSPNKKNRFDNWIGQPELSADRSTSNISFSLGFDINLMKENITTRNGIKNSLWVRLNPIWTDWFKDGTHDFFMLWDKLDLSWTICKIRQSGEKDINWFSIVLDNSTTYRYITGNKIPYYIQGGHIFGLQALNTEHVLTNRTSLTFYGPQINSYDCYPYISGFIDIGFSAGKLLNAATPEKYFDFIGSTGIKMEFIIFNIASFYYEIGYIFNNVLNEDNTVISRFGFSFGV